jgi:UPF0755 protein
MLKRLVGAAALLLLLLAMGAGAAFWWGLRSLDQPLAVTAAQRYRVVAGASFAHIAQDLAARGILAQPRAWVLYARWKGLATTVKAGDYELLPGLTPRDLLGKMVRGEVLLYSFTIVDGWRVVDMLAALRRNPEVTQTLGDQPSDLMQKIGQAGLPAEGQFLPQTYRFAAGTSDVELLQEAHAALSRELAADWNDRDTTEPLASPMDLLILASIVEKESSLAEELPKVAGVYVRRLTIGMRLQADPTLIYGLGADYDGSLHTVDLRTDGPYNTYTRAGLPPTPISLPSAATIRATAHATPGEEIYFVASTNGDGSHVFSATLAQQNSAVAKYVARHRHRHRAAASAPP